MSGLNCRKCGQRLHLGYDSKKVKTENGIKIKFLNTPILICGHCDSKYVPYMTDEIIKQACEVIEEPMKKADGKDVEEQAEVYCYFDVIKREVCDEKFIAEKVKFIYDRDDYYFIPGLIRAWNIGFLTQLVLNEETPIWMKIGSETSSMENYNVTEDFRTMDCNAGIVVTLTVSDEIVE